MTKKIDRLDDYITARHAAHILSLKHGRPIKPGYVHKLQKVRFVRLDNTSKLYHKDDIESIHIRKRNINKKQDI